MAFTSAVQGGYGAGGSVIPHESSAHSVLVPDTELLFTAQFHRAGPDLVLTGRDGQHHLVPGYFASEHHPALVAPNGAHLSPDTVDLLAGSATPGHYAQAQPTAPPDAIGKIEKVVGDVTVVRNGVTVALHVGDAVLKSDVIQTGASAACGISFPDGTVLNLVANTRMALNEYAYDANSNSNGALFTLVEGTFAFVAGKVAHAGDMKIATPVATMGIRGTTGVVEEQPNAPATITSQAAGHTYTFAVMPDIGTGTTGMWDVFLTDANGNIVRDANGNPIVLVTVSQSGFVTYVTPQGLGQPPLVTTEPATNSQYAFEQEMLHQLFLTLNPANLNNNNSNGSSTTPPPFELPNPIPQLFEDTGKGFTFNGPGSNPAGPPPVDFPLGGGGPLNVVIWIAGGSGFWSGGQFWLGGAPPSSPQEVIIPNYKVTTDGADSAAGLVVDADGILNIVSGTSFTIYDFIHGAGTIELNASGSDPTLFIDGTVSLVGGGTIEMIGTPGEDDILGVGGSHALLINVDYTIEGTGAIGRGDGNLTFENFGTVNANNGLLTVNTGNQVYNDGLMEATAGGTLQIEDSVANAGTIKADGIGAVVELSGKTFDNLFSVIAQNSGSITFNNVAVTNEAVSATDPTGGTIDATGGGTITFNGGSLANGNVLEATNGGTLQLENLTVTNSATGELSIDALSELDLENAAVIGGTIDNAGNVVVTAGSSLLDGMFVTNSGTIIVESGASLTLEAFVLTNDSTGSIEADGGSIDIEINNANTTNNGLIEALDGGTVTIDVNANGSRNNGTIEADNGTVIINSNAGGGGGDHGGGNYGTIEAIDGGTVAINGGITNRAGATIEAIDPGSTVDFSEGETENLGTIKADGTDAQVNFTSGMLDNSDLIVAENGGAISLASVLLTNEAGAVFEATRGGTIDYNTGGVTNDGIIEADHNGAITFKGQIGITNEAGGVIEALSGGSITFSTSGIGSVTNAAGGLIEASSGGTIIFDSTLNGAQNAGTIMAGAGGTVIIDGFEGGNGLFNGDGMGGVGTIEAIGAGAKIELAGATIIGGKLGTMGGGVFETVSGTSTLMNVILTGGVFTTDSGTILDLNGGSNGVAAYIDSTVILEGAGTVEMDFTSYSIRGGLSNGTLDNRTTIKGQGTIGNGDTPLPGVLTLINSGTIEAVGGEFIINTGTRNAATTTNSGMLEANGVNAVLLIEFTNINNANGTIAALNGLDAVYANASVVELLDVNIVGGTLETSNFGIIETVTDNGAATTSSFDNVTNDGYVYVGDNTTLILRDTIANTEGKIALGFGGNATLQIDGTVTLAGGAVELNGGSDKIVAHAAGAKLDNTSTIYGAGQIGAGDGKLTLDNQSGGTVDADINGATLTIHTGNAITNAGTLEAMSGGTLQIDDAVNNSGMIKADGGTVWLTGGYTNYGTIEATDCGVININLNDGDGPNYGLIEALNGTINITVTGYNSNHGTLEAGAGGTINFNRVDSQDNPNGGNFGTVEAIDGGKIDFTGSSGSNSGTQKAVGIGSTITFDLAAEDATQNNNGGTMEALCGGAIIVNGGTLNNSYNTSTNTAGIIEASSGGSVTVNGGTTNNSGGSIIEALSGGIVTFDDDAKTAIPWESVDAELI